MLTTLNWLAETNEQLQLLVIDIKLLSGDTATQRLLSLKDKLFNWAN
ncbi:hypothetical protein SAMN05216326_10211 [Nitrosomonas marina]|uniref:Uncharacterized protein n=1 Tax=Nitrosomonas marina TaxID=917 RepID=A0A1H9YI74_9PROT|nr:hypothetical protein SAMN05216326_10211 [Nitrosomonas marina]